MRWDLNYQISFYKKNLLEYIFLKHNLEFTEPSWHCCAMQYNTITGKGKKQEGKSMQLGTFV